MTNLARSRRSPHLLQVDESGKTLVVDLDSHNGTWVNGRSLRSTDAVLLSPGDEIVFGDSHLAKYLVAELVNGAVAAPAAVAPPTLNKEQQRVDAASESSGAATGRLMAESALSTVEAGSDDECDAFRPTAVFASKDDLAWLKAVDEPHQRKGGAVASTSSASAAADSAAAGSFSQQQPRQLVTASAGVAAAAAGASSATAASTARYYYTEDYRVVEEYEGGEVRSLDQDQYVDWHGDRAE